MDSEDGKETRGKLPATSEKYNECEREKKRKWEGISDRVKG